MDRKLTQKGFTLIEVLVMTVLLAMAFLVFLGSLNLGRDLQNKSEIKSVQAILLHDLQEQIKSRRYDESLVGGWSSSLGPDAINDYSLSFDGSNDYVQLAGNPVNTSTSNLTIGFRFKTTQTSNGTLYFETTIMGRGIWIRMEPSSNRIRAYSGSSGNSNIITTSSPYNDGVWRQFVYTASNGNLTKIYIDGNKVAENAGSFNTGTTSGPGILGRMGQPGYGSPYDHFNGNYDEFMVWNRALTDNEISAFAANSPTGNENGLVTYLKFDEGTGSVAYDLSGPNNGTLNGVSWVNQSLAEVTISDFDDVDDFRNYQITQYADHPAFSAQVQVEYVKLATKFRVVSATPSEYKRVVVNISHSSFSTLSDTLIIGGGL